MFYVGIIGSKLHPLMTAGQLADGPVESGPAKLESTTLPPETQVQLVGQACTRVGLFCAGVVGAVAAFVVGYRWDVAIGSACLTLLLVATALKLAFHTSRSDVMT